MLGHDTKKDGWYGPLKDMIDEAPACTLRTSAMKPPVHLALLFMIGDTLYNENVWSLWLKNATSEGLHVTTVVHASEFTPNGFNQTSSFIRAHLMREHTTTKWCDSFHAQILAIQEALKININKGSVDGFNRNIYVIYNVTSFDQL
jgi:hypothetical protein